MLTVPRLSIPSAPNAEKSGFNIVRELVESVNNALRSVMDQVQNIPLSPISPVGVTATDVVDKAKVGFMDAQYRQITTTGQVAGTEFALAHDLGRVPFGVIVVIAEQGTDNVVYRSSGVTAWTSSNLYLKSTVDNSKGTFLIF